MKTTGKVTGIISNLVTVETNGPVSQNEICLIDLQGVKLMAEVIKVNGDKASVQVYESTRGLQIGNPVEFQDHMLEVTLGPGLLSSNFDGLQNNLATMKDVFLKRGEYTKALDEDKLWDFTPIADAGQQVVAADWLGEVKEGWLPHKIMVPFAFEGTYTVKSVVPAGQYKITDTIAVLTNADGEEVKINMTQRWPVKVPIGGYVEKPRPFKVMETGVRTIDTLNPIAEGGTGFIPGPFGCGKTVLQHALAEQADADIIIMAACGERANEVVEIFTEFYGLTVQTTDAEGNATYGFGGKIIAFDRSNGAVRWEIVQTGNADYVSSPLVIYNARGDAYLIACDRDGNIRLYDASRPGENSLYALKLGERIDATPVAFNNYIVVATTGSLEQTRIFCLKLS